MARPAGENEGGKGSQVSRYDNNSDYRGIREITGERRVGYIIEHWPDSIPRANACAGITRDRATSFWLARARARGFAPLGGR